MPYGVVYGLYDPRTMELRYVGQTTSSLVVRVRGHMCAEHNAKISAATKGKRRAPKTEAQKQHMSAILKGRTTNSSEHMARLAELHRGVKRSAETRQRMSIAKKGKPSTFLGKHHSEATKDKIRAANKKRSPEARSHYKHISTEVILSLVASGRSYRSLAAEFGVSKTCIGRRVRQSKNG